MIKRVDDGGHVTGEVTVTGEGRHRSTVADIPGAVFVRGGFAR